MDNLYRSFTLNLRQLYPAVKDPKPASFPKLAIANAYTDFPELVELRRAIRDKEFTIDNRYDHVQKLARAYINIFLKSGEQHYSNKNKTADRQANADRIAEWNDYLNKRQYAELAASIQRMHPNQMMDKLSEHGLSVLATLLNEKLSITECKQQLKEAFHQVNHAILSQFGKYLLVSGIIIKSDTNPTGVRIAFEEDKGILNSDIERALAVITYLKENYNIDDAQLAYLIHSYHQDHIADYISDTIPSLLPRIPFDNIVTCQGTLASNPELYFKKALSEQQDGTKYDLTCIRYSKDYLAKNDLKNKPLGSLQVFQHLHQTNINHAKSGGRSWLGNQPIANVELHYTAHSAQGDILLPHQTVLQQAQHSNPIKGLLRYIRKNPGKLLLGSSLGSALFIGGGFAALMLSPAAAAIFSVSSIGAAAIVAAAIAAGFGSAAIAGASLAGILHKLIPVSQDFIMAKMTKTPAVTASPMPAITLKFNDNRLNGIPVAYERIFDPEKKRLLITFLQSLDEHCFDKDKRHFSDDKERLKHQTYKELLIQLQNLITALADRDTKQSIQPLYDLYWEKCKFDIDKQIYVFKHLILESISNNNASGQLKRFADLYKKMLSTVDAHIAQKKSKRACNAAINDLINASASKPHTRKKSKSMSYQPTSIQLTTIESYLSTQDHTPAAVINYPYMRGADIALGQTEFYSQNLDAQATLLAHRSNELITATPNSASEAEEAEANAKPVKKLDIVKQALEGSVQQFVKLLKRKTDSVEIPSSITQDNTVISTETTPVQDTLPDEEVAKDDMVAPINTALVQGIASEKEDIAEQAAACQRFSLVISDTSQIKTDPAWPLPENIDLVSEPVTEVMDQASNSASTTTTHFFTKLAGLTRGFAPTTDAALINREQLASPPEANDTSSTSNNSSISEITDITPAESLPSEEPKIATVNAKPVTKLVNLIQVIGNKKQQPVQPLKHKTDTAASSTTAKDMVTNIDSTIEQSPPSTEENQAKANLQPTATIKFFAKFKNPLKRSPSSAANNDTAAIKAKELAPSPEASVTETTGIASDHSPPVEQTTSEAPNSQQSKPSKPSRRFSLFRLPSKPATTASNDKISDKATLTENTPSSR